MNNEEEVFLAEMADLAQDLPPLSEEELLRLHTRTLEKAGLKKKKNRPALRICKWVAAAAVMTFALLGAGATYFKVSDLFRNVLAPPMADAALYASGADERTSADETTEGSAYCIPETAYENTTQDIGAVLNDARQSKTASGITLKAEGFVGDADTLMLMLSAESGAGLLTGDLRPGEVWLTSTAGDGTVYEQRLCDVEAVPAADGKSARFLVKGKLSQSVEGQPITLTVRDITRFENSRGDALLLIEQDLYAFWTKLGDARLNHFEEASGQRLLLGEGDGGIPLLQDDASLTLCAMGMRDGVFYFNVAGEGINGEPPVENLVLQNKTTGALLTGFTSVSGTQNHYFYRFEIPGIENPEELQNYTLVKNGGWCSVKIAEDLWQFEITPVYRDLSKTILLEQDVNTAQGTLYFDTLTVSPISVSLTGSVLFEPDFASLTQHLRLRMTDGSFVALDSMEASYTVDTGAFTLAFILPRMIEPDKLMRLETDSFTLTFPCTQDE